MTRRILPTVLLLLIALTGCDSQSLMRSFTPKEEAEARTYVEDIRAHNYGPVKAALDPRLLPSVDAGFQQMAKIMPGGKPLSVKVVGSHTMNFNGEVSYDFLWEYEFTGKWILAHLQMNKPNGKTNITTIYLTPMARSLEEQNAFTLSNKTPVHYLTLLAAILFPLFTIATAIVCWRTKVPRRKWLWILFILCGLGQFSLNWITGAFDVGIGFDLFGADWHQDLYGPPILQIGFPIGAILFWWRRRQWLMEPPADLRG